MPDPFMPVSPTADLTIQAASGQGRLVKGVNFIVNQALANQSVTDFTVPTPDDNLLRFFIGVFSSDTTAGLVTRMLSSGRKMFETGDEIFSPQHGPVGCYVPVAPNVQLVLEIANKSGGAVTPVSWNFIYAVDDPNWTIGG